MGRVKNRKHGSWKRSAGPDWSHILIGICSQGCPVSLLLRRAGVRGLCAALLQFRVGYLVQDLRNPSYQITIQGSFPLRSSYRCIEQHSDLDLGKRAKHADICENARNVPKATATQRRVSRTRSRPAQVPHDAPAQHESLPVVILSEAKDLCNSGAPQALLSNAHPCPMLARNLGACRALVACSNE